jgi:hypothetical protein
MDHQESRLTQRFGMAGLVERIRDLQCWILGLVKIEHCYLLTVAEADQLSSVIQRAHKIERSDCLEWNRRHCLDLCRIRHIEDGEPRAILLLNVKINLAVAGLIQEERLSSRLRHLRKIRRLLNNQVPRMGLDLCLDR